MKSSVVRVIIKGTTPPFSISVPLLYDDGPEWPLNQQPIFSTLQTRLCYAFGDTAAAGDHYETGAWH
jgi:hypothetical protein